MVGVSELPAMNLAGEWDRMCGTASSNVRRARLVLDMTFRRLS